VHGKLHKYSINRSTGDLGAVLSIGKKVKVKGTRAPSRKLHKRSTKKAGAFQRERKLSGLERIYGSEVDFAEKRNTLKLKTCL
jgi:hypothetical protein